MKALYGKVLKDARRRSEMTQTDVAGFLGMSQGNLSDIERGKLNAAEPTQELADYLNADYDYLQAAWKMSQPIGVELHTEDRTMRRFWFHHVAKREGLKITLEEFDQMMVEHVDRNHMKRARKK
jgi:transcriptional regulator with XRE-family HTH domain